MFIGSTYSLISFDKLFLAWWVVDGRQLAAAVEYLCLTRPHLTCSFPLALQVKPISAVNGLTKP
jgi:hypothetical protein